MNSTIRKRFMLRGLMSVVWCLLFVMVSYADYDTWRPLPPTWQNHDTRGLGVSYRIDEVQADERGGFIRLTLMGLDQCKGQVQRFRYSWMFDRALNVISGTRGTPVVNMHLNWEGDRNDCINMNPFSGSGTTTDLFSMAPRGEARFYAFEHGFHQPGPRTYSLYQTHIWKGGFFVGITGGLGPYGGIDLRVQYLYEGGAAEAFSGDVIETVIVPSARPGRVTSRTVLEQGISYEIEASGTADFWTKDFKGGVDPVWCYAEWRCGKQGEPWHQLRINEQGLQDIAGTPIPYNASHVYRVNMIGNGRSLEMYILDAQGSSGDNSGDFTVKISRRQPRR